MCYCVPVLEATLSSSCLRVPRTALNISTTMTFMTVVTKVPLPAFIPPDAVVAALHAYQPLIEANPHLTNYERRPVGIEEVVKDDFFRTDGHRLQAYTCFQRITIIPGVGAWATKDISVPCVFQSFAHGVRCRADAGSGVKVWSSYEVRRRGEVQGTGPDLPPGPDDGDFELVEIANVECGAIVRPFVRRSLATSHQEILEKIADEIGRAYLLKHAHPSQSQLLSSQTQTLSSSQSQTPSFSSSQSHSQSYSQLPSRTLPPPQPQSFSLSHSQLFSQPQPHSFSQPQSSSQTQASAPGFRFQPNQPDQPNFI